jgi:PAS domain S-box-containing protein
MNTDITERKKAEDSIRFQAHLLDVVEQAVIATDLDGVVIYWNQFAQRLYGWSAVEAVGRNITELTTPEINQEQAAKIMAQLRAGQSWSGEFMVQNKNGATFPAHVTNSPVNDKGTIIGIVGVSIDITERKLREEALRKAEAQYRNLVESSPAIVYLAEPVPPFSPIYISPNVASFGYTIEEWFSRPDMWISLIHEEDREHVLRITEDAMQQGLDTDLEYRVISRDGTIRWLHDKGRFILDDQGKRVSWQGVMLDITETKRLEEQLMQAQKLESVGRLAGGIAHDFNNMLTAINGYSELTLRALEADNPLRHNVEEIKKAGERSALLTHQLLAFSRRQFLQPELLDLNEVITDTTKMLERVIGEDIQLVIALKPKTGLVSVDPGQLSQIIMNLAVNARDAMPQGGTLSIETANIFLEPEDAKQKVGILPGAYVMLAVCDTGHGIDDSIRQHIFEPFFTTKEVGRGTGLGLATVYGIVKQSGGNIEVESREGVGTTFRIYLPRVEDESEAAEVKNTSTELPTGTETILLVEDEELVRNLSREILETCGYTVIKARDGLEALECCDKGDCKIDLLMTDIVMPRMGGRELAEKLTKKLPNLKILFTSGYADNEMVHHDVIETSANFIQKPFTLDALAHKVREVLNAAAG